MKKTENETYEKKNVTVYKYIYACWPTWFMQQSISVPHLAWPQPEAPNKSKSEGENNLLMILQLWRVNVRIHLRH